MRHVGKCREPKTIDKTKDKRDNFPTTATHPTPIRLRLWVLVVADVGVMKNR